jgi:DNA helicase-2/ATP-dependent DNA helicase PcrA
MEPNNHKSIAPGLNPEQKKAAEAPIAPLLIVAGAGTGKTKTLTTRIVNLIRGGLAPQRICAITFTNKAAAEMAHRIGGLLRAEPPSSQNGLLTGNPQATPYMGTFHSLGARILRQECRAFGREPNFAIFDDHDSFDLLKKAVKAVFPPAPKREDEGMGQIRQRAKERLKGKESPAAFAKKISELKNLPPEKVFEKMKPEDVMKLQRVYENYEAALARNNAFDFDDLIQKPVALFRSHPEILQKYQNRYDAVLVDEYQDINPKQYEFVSLLAGKHRNLTVVGDDEQTIYTWRYADIGIFLGFEKDWPGAGVHFLEENYRSTGNIINGASAVVRNNKFRTPKQLWTKKEAGDPIILYEAWGENDEAAWIGEEIRKTRAKNPSAEIAILYRTNAQSRPIEQALIRENIPYKIYGGLKFYERREVKDAVAALRYAANSRDEVSRERLEKNLTKRKFAEFREAVLGIKDPKPTSIIKVFLETFDYFDYIDSNFINAEERRENIAELITFASEFENLSDLLERLSLVQSTDDDANKPATANSNDAASIDNPKTGAPVHLSTVHLAKGLEFETVFIAGAAEGLLPHIRSIDNDASLEEERRLMYVAMTRAKEKLRISFFGLPSRFVSEIPEEYIVSSGDAMRDEAGDRGPGNGQGNTRDSTDNIDRTNWREGYGDDGYHYETNF